MILMKMMYMMMIIMKMMRVKIGMRMMMNFGIGKKEERNVRMYIVAAKPVERTQNNVKIAVNGFVPHVLYQLKVNMSSAGWKIFMKKVV
jgi:hypothetical protein